jgi:hypothetical protein
MSLGFAGAFARTRERSPQSSEHPEFVSMTRDGEPLSVGRLILRSHDCHHRSEAFLPEQFHGWCNPVEHHGSAVNGWTFWEYKLPGQDRWQILKSLRRSA